MMLRVLPDTGPPMQNAFVCGFPKISQVDGGLVVDLVIKINQPVLRLTIEIGNFEIYYDLRCKMDA